MRWFQSKNEIFYFRKEYPFSDHFRWRSFITLITIFLRLPSPFPLRNISCDVHMTCIKVILIYTINPLPCMFYLSPALCQSLALFLSLSSGHVSLWGLTAMLQMQPLLEPVWNRTSKPKVKNSEITNCGTLQQWRVYAATPFTRAGSYLAEFF